MSRLASWESGLCAAGADVCGLFAEGARVDAELAALRAARFEDAATSEARRSALELIPCVDVDGKMGRLGGHGCFTTTFFITLWYAAKVPSVVDLRFWKQ